MKLQITQKSLNKALSAAGRAAAKRTTIPILSYVLFEASGNQVVISGTDLDIEIKSHAEAAISQGGAVCVPAGPFMDISKKMADGKDVSIELDNNRLTIKSGRTRFHLNTLPAQDWPEITSKETPHEFSINAITMQRLFEKTAFAISTEETRYYLNGIYFHLDDDEQGKRLKAVATDGHRLSLISAAAPTELGEMPGIIIPRKTVIELSRLIADAPEDVLIKLSDTFIIFNIGETVLSSKVIDGTYPDYKRVIPMQSAAVAGLDKKAAIEAVARVSTISSERGRAVKFAFEKGKLALSVTNPDMGDAADEIEADYDFATIEIGFNSAYVQECLSTIDGESFCMRLTDPGAPCIITCDDPDRLMVIMPMRV